LGCSPSDLATLRTALEREVGVLGLMTIVELLMDQMPIFDSLPGGRQVYELWILDATEAALTANVSGLALSAGRRVLEEFIALESETTSLVDSNYQMAVTSIQALSNSSINSDVVASNLEMMEEVSNQLLQNTILDTLLGTVPIPLQRQAAAEIEVIRLLFLYQASQVRPGDFQSPELDELRNTVLEMASRSYSLYSVADETARQLGISGWREVTPVRPSSGTANSTVPYLLE
jgi:hypothetical protein